MAAVNVGMGWQIGAVRESKEMNWAGVLAANPTEALADPPAHDTLPHRHSVLQCTEI